MSAFNPLAHPEYLVRALADKVQHDLEEQMRAIVQPQVDAMIREAALSACSKLKASIESVKDVRQDRLVLAVRFNSDEFRLAEPDGAAALRVALHRIAEPHGAPRTGECLSAVDLANTIDAMRAAARDALAKDKP